MFGEFIHRFLVTLMHIERRTEPFWRPYANAALREPSAAFLVAIESMGGEVIDVKGQTYRVKTPGTASETCKLAFQAAAKVGAQVRGFQLAERSLEDAFLEAIHAPKPEEALR